MAKIELQIGEVEFECEGDEIWVMKMYQHFLLDFLPKQIPAKTKISKAVKVKIAKPKKEKKVKVKKIRKVKPKKAKLAKKPAKILKPLTRKRKPKTKVVVPALAKPMVAMAPKEAKVPAVKPAVVKPAKTVAVQDVKPIVAPVMKAKKPAKVKKAKPKTVAVKLVEPARAPLPAPTVALVKQITGGLAEFLKANNADETMMRKFLLTAIWLQSNGQSRMRPMDVNTALVSIGMPKFNRPTDSLKNNVKKHYCGREGDKFFVTELGLKQAK